MLYESLRSLDSATKRPRGFALISRDLDSFSRIESVGSDLVSKKNLQTTFASPSFIVRLEAAIKDQQSPLEYMRGLLQSFGWDFNVLLVYNMYEVGDYFDKQGE